MITEKNVNQVIFDYAVGKMVFGDRQFKVVFIPVEIREGLKSVLRGYEG